VSSIPDALLPTVRSRCPRLRFGPLSAAEVAQALVRDHGYTETDARAAAADADGSIGRALSADSADLTQARDEARRLLEQTAKTEDPARRLDAVRDLTGTKGTSASDRDQMAACLRALASLLRDLGIVATQGDRRTLANADAAFAKWRSDHPREVPHIRQTTWGIPRTWFVLVVEDERELYEVSGQTSVRYRATVVDAKRRLGRAHAVLRKVIDETELLDELTDLTEWLDAFDADSWVELDYAGIATLLGEGLAADESARDIHRALAAL